MTTETPSALEIALEYHDAWTGSFDAAMQHVADDIVCEAPPGRIDGASAFRAFMEPFVRSLTRYECLAAFGDGATAVVVYDTDTELVDGAPGAEWVTVEDGRITHMRIIFDRLPFAQARGTS
jgi:limonene-1,2-epoxide hydrolase